MIRACLQSYCCRGAAAIEGLNARNQQRNDTDIRCHCGVIAVYTIGIDVRCKLKRRLSHPRCTGRSPITERREGYVLGKLEDWGYDMGRFVGGNGDRLVGKS